MITNFCSDDMLCNNVFLLYVKISNSIVHSCEFSRDPVLHYCSLHTAKFYHFHICSVAKFRQKIPEKRRRPLAVSNLFACFHDNISAM